MNLSYYLDLGYDISGDFIPVLAEHLLPNCKEIVDVSCDYCGRIDSIKFIKYNRSLNSIIKKYACSECKVDKIKESNLLKWGVTSVAMLESSKLKSKKTNLEKYGVEFHTQSESTKRKIKETNIERWGVENPMKSTLIKDKQKKTIFNSWGVDNISKVEQVKDKKRNSYFNNFGVYHPLKSDEIKKKIKITNKLRWGNEYVSKSEKWRKSNYDISNDPNYISYIEDGISLFNCSYGLDHQFKISKDVYSKRKLYNVSLCTICNPIGDLKSIKEKELFNYIRSIYNGEIVQSHRDGIEIDIYLPELKLGFEFNGLYWHSDECKDKNYHLRKTNWFKDRGIRIIHIWEDDWDFKSDIVKSQIKNLLGINTSRIFARKCQVKEIDNKLITKSFLNENHIQGSVNSILKLGLFFGDELVSLMTFDHFEGRDRMGDNEWNLNRFCTKLNCNVIGGASKLLSYFINEYNPKRIISYADLDWSDGDLYHKLGFKFKNQTIPDYKYILDNKRVHKSKFRKSLTGISESKLELPKVWNCGKLKFEIIFFT
jgi:hypothetical protein